MDLNALYFRHQVLQMRAEHSLFPEQRTLHGRRAAALAARIGWLQLTLGAGAAPGWAATAAGAA